MKKQHLLFFIAAALAAGCTSPDQDQQIRLFWMQQSANLMTKALPKLPQTSLPRPSDANRAETLRTQQAAPKAPARPQPQVIDVTLETDALPGQAPYAERVRMKRAWDAVQISNQKTLDDIATAFGEQVKDSAFIITTNTEKQLKQAARRSPNFAAYFAQQQELLKKQEQDLNTLMAQNRTRIKTLKTNKKSL